MQALTENELTIALSDLDDWTVDGGKLTKTFQFPGFREAITFLVRLSYEVEEINHHPEIENVYNRVRFALCTHDAGSAVTKKDVKLARIIEQLYGTTRGD